ncbi:PAS domain S-box-containing protein [Desulfatibacillum alkenivorans DSM 16219]|jgi:PAS domain S-box-containing protein|uniref:histidine kinase n=1 Tax=Desulfatibacillum alkenivorans DSM 16219 TaxID=1121393 RepID=A0A1M6U5W6_9BACT|nr:PAS domain S-box protein [Desulfatibacillum alkenivorans]SHK64564.1 PAS domain S-box-containing protein [Desulfatibacillum alkenivorans DSM 16219]
MSTQPKSPLPCAKGGARLPCARDLSRLGDSSDIFSAIINNANEAVLITQDGVIQAANKKASEISGRTLEELRSQPFLEFLHPEDRQLALERYLTRLDGREPEERLWVVRLMDKSGGVRYLESTGASITYEGKPAALHFFTDVTRRLQAEAQIRASETQYRYLVENASDAICIIQDRELCFFNKAAAAMLGYTHEEVLEIDLLDLVHPDFRERVVNAHLKRLKGEKVPNPYNFDAVAKSGKRINAQLTAAVIEWEGKPALLVLVRDVTESRKREEQIQQARRMEALGALAGGIAHDFNNLLMAIQGHASLMLLSSDLDRKKTKSLRCIEQCVRSGAELTSQLLGYAKGGKYQVRPHNLNTIIENTAAMFGRARKEIRIHLDLSPELWASEVDRAQIEQVLLNIYVNAWHAMDRGGDLFIRSCNCTVDEIQARGMEVAPGKFAKISITDTGVGMDEDTRKRIFEPFFTTREMGRGTGLGMASAYGIVKNHGGFIHVYSEKGRGATFSVFLAASETCIREAAPKNQTAALHRGRGLVLLADDEAMIRDVGGRMLHELGYEVITAADASEAVQLFRQNARDIKLVILDVIMPGSDVDEALRIIRKSSPEARILLSSGYSVEGQARSLMEMGCHGFIQKPFDIEELAGKIQAIQTH